MKRLLVIGYWLLVIGYFASSFGLATAASSLQPQTSYEVRDEAIRAAVIEYLDRTFETTKNNLTIEDIDIKSKVILPRNGISPEVLLPRGYKVPGKVNLMVNFKDRDFSKTIWVSAKVVRIKNIAVASRPLPLNHTIGREDIRIEKVNMADITGEVFSDVNMLLGMKVKRPVAVNSAVKGDYVYRPPVIKKGEVIDVVVEGKAVVIKLKCMAMEDGFVGNNIRIGNISSGKELTGLVIDSGKVVVRL